MGYGSTVGIRGYPLDPLCAPLTPLDSLPRICTTRAHMLGGDLVAPIPSLLAPCPQG